MKIDKLVQMANQIAAFFRSYPHDEACAGIRDHIDAFWTPRMRSTIMDHGPQDGLDPLVVAALQGRSGAKSPITKEREGPDAAGPMVSDAG